MPRWPASFSWRRLLPLLLASGSLLQCCRSGEANEEGTCAAGDSTCTPKGAVQKGAAKPAPQYYWPQQKGDVNRTGLSPYTAPFDLSGGPTWVWKDPYLEVNRFTPLIDDKRNIYVATLAGRFWKFSPDGRLLWQWEAGAAVPAVPALMDGSLFFNRRDGYVVSIDMETAAVNWKQKVADSAAGDTACVYAVDGLVVSAAEIGKVEMNGMGSNNAVVALHASNGSHFWTFKHRWPTFNFQASSPGDGTMVFQDRAGGVYRLALSNGSLLWESGVPERVPSDFTTGAAVVGPNGLVYAASNWRGEGIIHAYDLQSGKKVWMRWMNMSVNQAVAVGKLAGNERLSVVAGIGTNPLFPAVFYYVLIFLLLDLVVLCCCGCRCCRRACKKKSLRCCWSLSSLLLLLLTEAVLVVVIHRLSIALEAKPPWLFFVMDLPAAMVSLDAETGETHWRYDPPKFTKPACEGDEAHLGPRLHRSVILKEHGDAICLPDNWAQTVIDAEGTTYGGHQDGYLYAVRDADGSGTIDASREVSRYYLGNAFQASQAIAPGLLAVVPCGGGLFVWGS